MKARTEAHHFTLVEVLIALAILTMGILAAAGLVWGAQSRNITASRQWEEQHAMSQAAEYLLLAGNEDAVPERFFPYGDYRINSWYATPINLPSGVDDRQPGWRLATLHIQLLDKDGNSIRKLSLDRILKTEEK